MAVLRGELCGTAAALPRLATALRQNRARERARGLAQLPHGLGLEALEPGAALDEAADLQEKRRIARRLKSRAHPLVRGAARRARARFEQREIGLLRKYLLGRAQQLQ